MEILPGATVPVLSGPPKGKPPKSLYQAFLTELGKQPIKELQHGEFGADMQVALTNDGPVTIMIDTDEWKK